MRIGSTKSLSPLFCVPESVSVVVYSLAAIVSSEFQVNTNKWYQSLVTLRWLTERELTPVGVRPWMAAWSFNV
jgi:hypothetical protein